MRTASIFLAIMPLLWAGDAMSASYFKSLDYDEVRECGSFGSKAMILVSRMCPSLTPLSADEKEALVQSKTLINLHTIDLSNQNIDDDFIKGLSENPVFSRIITLDLCGNANITDKSMEYLLESPYIGSLRDLPQVSGRYGCPATVIYVRARGTSVKKQPKNPLFNFSITYQNAITGKETDERSEGTAIKFLEATT